MAPNTPATSAQITMTSGNGTWIPTIDAAAPERFAAVKAPMPINAT